MEQLVKKIRKKQSWGIPSYQIEGIYGVMLFSIRTKWKFLWLKISVSFATWKLNIFFVPWIRPRCMCSPYTVACIDQSEIYIDHSIIRIFNISSSSAEAVAIVWINWVDDKDFTQSWLLSALLPRLFVFIVEIVASKVFGASVRNTCFLRLTKIILEWF